MDERDKRDSLFAWNRENIYFRWGLTALIVIALGIVLAQLVGKLPAVLGAIRALLGALSPVFYGLGIAYLLDPIVIRVQKLLEPRLARHMPVPGEAGTLARGLGILAALLLAVLIVWALLAMVLPQLWDSVNTIIGNLPAYYNTLRGWADRLISSNMQDVTEEAMNTIYKYVSNWLSANLLPRVEAVVVDLTASAVGMAMALLNLVIGLIISVYLLMSKEKFLAQAKKLDYALLGEKKGGYVCNVCTFANRTFGGFIGGKLLDSAIIGVLCFIGLSVMKMPYTMLISIIVGVTNVIPFFGPYLGAVPSALLLLVIDPWKALTFLIFILILQQLDGNVIGPRILGDATGLSSFWVVVSILVFGSFWGVLGMFLAVPLFAVIYQIVSEVANRLLARRGLSTETADYRRWNYPPRPEAEHWVRPRQRKLGRRGARASETEPEAEPEPPEE